MYRIDPERLDLVEEFKANPFGPYSHELERLVNRLRMGPVEDRYVLVTTKRYEEWTLGQLTGRRGDKIRLIEDARFDSLAQGEWEVFRRRWQALTGEDLESRVAPPQYAPGSAPARR